MNQSTWDIQDEIAQIEGQLESTDSAVTLSDGAIQALSSRLNHLYRILYELEREDD